MQQFVHEYIRLSVYKLQYLKLYLTKICALEIPLY
jgi:hypothetical protein